MEKETDESNKDKKDLLEQLQNIAVEPETSKYSDERIAGSLPRKMEMTEGSQMGTQFETYKKRKGTENNGKEYEYLMCAYYALKFALDKNVLNYKMTTNNYLNGDFDDVEIEITFSDESSCTFLIQLKHSIERRGVTENMLVREKGAFSLIKYFESYRKMEKGGNITYILLTNRKSQIRNDSKFPINLGDIKGEVTVKPYQPRNPNHLLINTAREDEDIGEKNREDTCFQFEFRPSQDSSEAVTRFFRKFCLFTNQINVTRSQILIKRMLIELFGCNIYFVNFMHHWWNNNFVLTKDDVIKKLAELALSPYIQEIPFGNEKYVSEKSKILKSAITKFDLTLVAECDNTIVTQMWTDSLEEIDIMSKAALKYGLSTVGFKSRDEMLPIDQSKVLWFLNKVPLIIKHDEDATLIIQRAVNLLVGEHKEMKIILLSNRSKEEFYTEEIFECLYDLRRDELLYNEIIETFNVSLQGRASISLKRLIQIDAEIDKDIKTKELFQMLEDDLCIGKSQEDLPETYIPRKLNSKEIFFIGEEELFSVIKNPLNAIIGKPGSGKTTLLNYLSQQCPPDCWCIRFNFNEWYSIFKEEFDNEAILNRIMKREEQVSNKLLDKFKTSRRIYLLLDGLDDIGGDCIKDVLEFIRYISDTGIKVWVTSRDSLKEIITLQLNVVSIEIQELNRTEQRNYIRRRLKSDTLLGKEYSENEVENITSKIFESVSINNNTEDLLGLPLYLHIITEIFRRQKQTIEFEEDFFVLSKLYRRFFSGQYEHQKAKAKIKYEQSFDNHFDFILKQFELPALRACLNNKTFDDLKIDKNELEESRTFLETIKREGNKLGIISQVVSVDQKLRAIFYHQSFAEYFACKWLERNVDKLRFIKNDFFNEQHRSLRLMFDIVSAEDKPLHLATIYKNPGLVGKYNKQNNDKDKRGRSALHIICSYSEIESKYEYADVYKYTDVYKYVNVLKILLQNHDPSEKDSLFNWNCLEYALRSKTLFPFDIILKIRNKDVHINDLFKFFKDTELVNYCCRFGYSHLLTAIVKERPNIIKKMSGDFICQVVKMCVWAHPREHFQNKYLKTLKILANGGCNLNQKEYKTNWTPLHYACRYGDCKTVETLLEYGCDINAVTNENATILHLASLNYQPKIIKFLIKKGMEVNQVDINSSTPLHYACRDGRGDVIKTLVENGSDIKAVTNENATVLHLASMNINDPKRIEFLIKLGMQVNQVDINNKTPLHYACQSSYCEVVETLLENGSDINAVTNENATMLHLASMNHKPAMIELLIKLGMQVNQVDINNKTPLHYACQSSCCKVVKMLLENGSDINAVTNENATMLHLASMNHEPAIIEFLIKLGMQVNQVDINNKTPLHYACQSSCCKVVKMLLENGSDINAVTNENATMLHLASMNHEPAIIEFLIKLGMQVNQVDKNNWTPLHYACQYNNRDVAKILLKNGSDIDALNEECNKWLVENNLIKHTQNVGEEEAELKEEKKNLQEPPELQFLEKMSAVPLSTEKSQNQGSLQEKQQPSNKEENVSDVEPSKIVAAVDNSQELCPIKKKKEDDDEFPRYKKKEGAHNEGLMCAYYVLKFCLGEHVIDVSMTTNDESYGDFLIQLTVTFADKSSHIFLIQLKYNHDRRKKLDCKMLNEEQDDFSLLKYFKSFQNIKSNINDDGKSISCMLFTNMIDNFENSDTFMLGEKKIGKKECHLIGQECSLLDTFSEETDVPHVFKFELLQNQDILNDENEFLSCFRLFTRQSDYVKIESCINTMLDDKLGFQNGFIEFIEKWCKQNFVLTKKDVIAKLAELALSPFIREIYKSAGQAENEKIKLLKSAIEKFDITYMEISFKNENTIGEIWAESTVEMERMSKVLLKYSLMQKEISSEDELSSYNKTFALWFLNEIPLIVKCPESEEKRIQRAIDLLTTENKKKKIILLGNSSKLKICGWRAFKNLYDLRNEQESYNKISKEFKVRLQQRESISLEELIRSNKEIDRVIETKHLFLMTEEDLSVGEENGRLPEVYISRYIYPDPLVSHLRLEETLFSAFIKPLNVIIEKPGVGKSTLITYLSSICPPNHWCVRVNLIEYNSLLKEEISTDVDKTILAHILRSEDQFISNLVEEFRKNGKIYLLFDGLDDIDGCYLNKLFNFINYVISSVRLKVWISSRENLKNKILKFVTRFNLDMTLLKIQELTDEQQKTYIRHRLINLPREEIEDITNKIFDTVNININTRQVLETPLQLYILTEILRNDTSKDVFVLSKMFRQFFKGKLEHQAEKARTKYQEAYDNNLEWDLKQYEIPALRACLNYRTFGILIAESSKELAKSQEFLEEIERRGDKLGIINYVYNKNQALHAIFTHQSFAEYFASLWLENNEKKLYDIKEEFFSDECQNIRLIFDITLAEKCPLHLAVLYKRADQVKQYCQCVEKDKRHRTALHVSLSYCKQVSLNNPNDEDLKILRILIDNLHPSILLKEDKLFAWNCFHYALQTRSLLPFEIILEKHQEVKVYDYLFDYYKNTSLLLNHCLDFGYSCLLKALFKEKPNIKDNFEGSPVWKTVRNIVKSNEIDVKQIYVKIFQVLVYIGCDLNERDDDGSTVLHFSSRKDVYAVQILLEYGADINATNSFNNWTPLHYACRYGNCDIVKTLLECRSDTNAVTIERSTMSHMAARNKNTDGLKYLIEQGVSINVYDENNRTPLYYACIEKNYEGVEILLKAGAVLDPYCRKSLTPNFHTILYKGNIQTVESLLKEFEKTKIAIRETIAHLPTGFPIHLAENKGILQPSLLLEMARLINEFRSTAGSSSDLELFKYLTENFNNVRKNKFGQVVSHCNVI